MFADCRQIQTIEIENFNSPQLKDMNNMFYGCESLISIDFKYVSKM